MVLGLILFYSCEPSPDTSLQPSDTSDIEVDTTGARQFMDRLTSLCGKSFTGQLMTEETSDAFTGKELIMHVLSCDKNKLLIPFNVGDNRSRTWILTYANGGIELKHDHRHEDGTSDNVTMYGGITTNSGRSHMVIFSADEETRQMLPMASSNVWWMTVSDSTFTYNLRRIGTDRLFTVAFDLTREVDTPQPSWGWEDFNPILPSR